MALRTWSLVVVVLALSATAARAQVFVVGEASATDGIKTSFTPTHVPLSKDKLTELGRRELVRNLEDEQGFAHIALPVTAAMKLDANGPLSPGPTEYRQLLYTKGQAVELGGRVMITSMEFKGDRIILDLNGGPYVKHRFLRHVQLNDSNVVGQTIMDQATGSRITLVFPGYIPAISAPEVKSLLAPVIDFGVKNSAEAYADTLPPLVKTSIEEHKVLVGMNQRMVLAALGEPENKVREHENGDPNAPIHEDWIYGHVPQTVRFIRFQGDRVTRVEIAALGKPLEVHDQDEMGGYNPGPPTREISLGDQQPGSGRQAPPTLRKPGEPIPAGGEGKVQFPNSTDKQPTAQPIPAPPSAPDVDLPASQTGPTMGPPQQGNPQSNPQIGAPPVAPGQRMQQPS
ncbi:hypothetical protein GCM10011507_11380 [Edaphobacter acidisoli]|uniref:Uncharacterized protein n=1 Tax=Edaphobacter acidisoli TaxID=2040573 RepID=A0A916RLA2_9BACT|nr:hypothetical protein [Edaphobacter acidisoli]GGA61588.1 hypothetical protein GCM10011507_11380 [Edaphobacter acidisoli]